MPAGDAVPSPVPASAPADVNASAPSLPPAVKEEAMPELDSSMSAYDKAMAQASS